MTLVGTTGGRCTACSVVTVRPSPARNRSPSRTTSTAVPSSRMRRYSVNWSRSISRKRGSGSLSASGCPRSSGEFGHCEVVGGQAGRAWSRESGGRSIEPQVYLSGAHRILVFAVLAGTRGAVALTQRPHHHQVVAEARLGLEAEELRHGLQDSRVVALGEPLDPLQVRGRRLRREDVLDTGRLVLSQLTQRPEGVTERAGRDQDDAPVRRGDRVPERPAEPQVVLGVPGLAHPNREPPLVRQAAAEVLPEV